MTAPPALVLLGEGSLATAQTLRGALPGATIHGLTGRVSAADRFYDDFGETLRHLFAEDVPVVAFCAAGIAIRALAPLLQNKRREPPVIAVAEDGSAVVPLLGGLRGVNALARRIGEILGTVPAITTTGEVRFGATLETPPEGYEASDPAAAKRFMSDLLGGATLRLEGPAPWLAETRLPFDPAGKLAIRVTPYETAPAPDELVFHPRAVLVALRADGSDLRRRTFDLLATEGVSPRAVAAVLAAEADAASPEVHAVAAALSRPLRLLGGDGPAALLAKAMPAPSAGPWIDGSVGVAIADGPVDPASVGRPRGRLAVIGLGPGLADWMAPEARHELAAAEDLVGYDTYLRMAGPFRDDQTVHASDNREELARARHALALAATGRRVAVVSSGDPGIFAMAAAVTEALETAADTSWHGVALRIVPGISAAQAAAARAGAPLGHDFCVISLSDNLKPWPVIERRLDLAAEADLAIALYNPISRARPWQLGKALEILGRHRTKETPVVIGRDVGRPDETIAVRPLGELTPDAVDMRTVLIVGSSTTRSFPRLEGGVWVYTPRWYGEAPES
ncbi:MAG: precorrin-3B C(17)-methyltransferase [Alphaproteobacteria bacterium]